MRRKFYVAAALLLFLLAGCAQKYAKPGATEDQMKAERAQCDSIAYRKFPPRMRKVIVKDAYYDINGVYMPALSYMADDNEKARGLEADSCMQTRGWQAVD